MTRNISLLALVFLFALASCNACNAATTLGTLADDTTGIRITTADEIAAAAASTLNSHEGEEQWSRLQPMRRTYTVLPHKWALKDDVVKDNFANYPRIKKMTDGEYIMFWHGGQFGSRIWCSISSDLKQWSTPTMLFKPEFPVLEDGKEDVRRYVNMDAAVLPNGEILAVCSYRAQDHYIQNMGSGLCTIRSSDNGRTWSEPHHIYKDCNWEPYLLVLHDGRIQCYFTDATPQCRNSGTSVMVSSDNGYTWSEKIRVCRQFKYYYDGPNTEYTGTRIYTDQMPCFRVLNDGKTLLGFLEARLENPASNQGNSYCRMSVVRNDGLDWKDLGENSEGPARRATNVLPGGSGYVAVFPSGETVLSCNNSSTFKVKVLTCEGECPPDSSWEEDWSYPLPGKGFWGSSEVDSPLTMVVAMHCDDGIQIEKLWLNHRIDAENSPVTLDADNSEWAGVNEALFLSSEEGDETLIRARHDGENLYLLIETAYQSDAPGEHRLNLRLCGEGAKKYGILSIDTVSGKVEAKRLSQTSASATGRTSDGRKGSLSEIAVPLSSLGGGAEGDCICIYAEAATESGTSPFSLTESSMRSTWQRIRLK